MAIIQPKRSRRAAVILIAGAGLLSFGGLALAASDKNPGSAPAPAGAAKSEEKGEGTGLPRGTHGYAVSKIAHETPPGPGHGKAVSAVARSWGEQQRAHRPSKENAD